MHVRVFPAKERLASPWKNGKGITREVAVCPPAAGLEDFAWRISLAEVARGGPFSRFPDVDRTLAVLDGMLLLRIGTQPAVALAPGSRPVTFGGDEPCHADNESRVVQDLNVMTRRGRYSSRLALIEACGPMTIGLTAGETVILALHGVFIETNQSHMELAPLDAALLETGAKDTSPRICDIRPIPGRASSCLYVIDLIEEL